MIRVLMIFTMCNFACIDDSTDLIDTEDLQKVEVKYVYLRTTTPITISCNAFIESFDDIKSKTLIGETQWKYLITEINRVIKKGETFEEGPDVRMTIRLHYTDKVMLVCIGNTITLVNGNNFVNDDLFRDFITLHFEE